MSSSVSHQSMVRRGINAVIDQALRFDTLTNALTGLGGATDKGTQVAVDTTRISLTQPELDILGRYNGYATAWFDRLTEEATLTGWDIKEGAGVHREFAKLERAFKLRKVFRQALKLACNDGGSLILMVTKGAGHLSRPLRLDRVKSIAALHVFDRSEFEVLSYTEDWRKPDWRHPEFYSISASVSGSDVGGFFTSGQKVHHSRVIYIPGRELGLRLFHQSGGRDDSLLDPAWDALRDMTQTDSGGAVLAQEMKQNVIKIAGLEGVEAGSLADVLEERLRTLVAGMGLLNAVVLGENDEFLSKAATVSGFDQLKAAVKSTWAAVTGQPEIVAFGSTPGGLSTDGEAGRRGQDRMVGRFQETHLRCPLERLYEVFAAARNLGDDWRLEFRDLGTMTPMERAAVYNQNAQTDRIYRQEGILTAGHIQESRFGPDGYGAIRPVPADSEIAGDPTRALNGPQARSLLEVVLQVATERLPRKSGVAMIVHAFNLSPDAAEEVMDVIGDTFTIDPVEAGVAPDVSTPADDMAVQTGGAEGT